MAENNIWSKMTTKDPSSWNFETEILSFSELEFSDINFQFDLTWVPYHLALRTTRHQLPTGDSLNLLECSNNNKIYYLDILH